MAQTEAFRSDIQALRGIAVLLVVLDHFSIGPFAHGYLGVDVFFVISGFLITGIVARDITNGTFSFKLFYFRRMRRILPAALVTVLSVTMLSAWFLTAHEMRSLNAQVAGAATFSINFVLWHRVDYFAVDAASMPLLHYWSLAVEEQFYIFLPMLLWIVGRRSWVGMLAVLFGASLLLCFVWMRFDPSGAFYLLPTRAWELLTGALCALLFTRLRSVAGVFKVLTLPALLSIGVLASVSTGLAHPGLDAALVCCATAVVLLADWPRWAGGQMARPLVALGDISYALYLVHWPIAVFMSSAVLREITVGDRLIGLCIALVCAIVLYRLVEEPCRRGIRVPSPRFAGVLILASAGAVGLQYGAQSYGQHRHGFLNVRANNYGLARECAFHSTVPPVGACTTSERPRTLIWGDSHAMQIVPGLAKRLDGGVAQITRTACGPYLSVSQKSATRGGAEAWARECMAFNRRVLAYVESSPHIETVVLGTPFRYLLDPDEEAFVRQPDGSLHVAKRGVDLAVGGIRETIAALEKAGKRVVLFGSPPQLTKGDANCAERFLTGRVSFGLSSGCAVRRADVIARDRNFNAVLERVERETGARVIRIANALCNEVQCETIVDGVVIYRDRSHLTNAGSHKVMERLGIGARLD